MRPAVLILAVCGLHIAISLAWAAAHPEAPRPLYTPTPVVLHDAPCPLTSDEPVFDTGPIAQGSELEHVYRVTNSGRQAVEIGRVDTSCGCTKAELTWRRLAPGQSAEIKVGFSSGAITGPFQKTIRLHVAPEGSLLLTLRGRVIPDFLPDPAALSFGTVPLGEEARRSVRFYPTRPQARWTLGAPFTVDPDVRPSEPVADGSGYRVDLRLTARRPGPKTGVLTLPGKVPLSVRYSATVSP